jgi:hypothetical protein
MLNRIKLMIKFNRMEEVLGNYFKGIADPRSLRNQHHLSMTFNEIICHQSIC